MDSVTLSRSLLLWSAIIPFAIANGLFREKILLPRLGKSLALATSGVLLALIIIVFATATIRWIPPATAATYLKIGAVWLIATGAFELSFGRLVAKEPWPKLLNAYVPKNGNLWLVVIVAVAVAPVLAAKLRGLI